MRDEFVEIVCTIAPLFRNDDRRTKIDVPRMHRRASVRAPRWNFIKIKKRKKEKRKNRKEKREGKKKIVRTISASIRDKRMDGRMGGDDWATKIDFFRARCKREREGNGSISSVLIHRGGKSGVPRERDQSVGRSRLAATRNAVGTRRSHFSRLYHHCRRLWLCQ